MCAKRVCQPMSQWSSNFPGLDRQETPPEYGVISHHSWSRVRIITVIPIHRTPEHSQRVLLRGAHALSPEWNHAFEYVLGTCV